LRQQTIFGAGRPQVDVTVGADGRFATEDLTPGPWQVSWVSEAGVASGSQVVEIPSVELFEVEVSYPGLAVTGQVRDEEGKPVEGARVRELTTGALAFAAKDGSFSLTGLAGPKAVLQARLDDLSSTVRELSLSPDRAPEPVILTLSRRSASRIEVQVSDTAGSPMSGAFVFLDEEGKGVRILTTAADGNAAASFEPPLPARVRAAAVMGSHWALGGWLSWDQAEAGLSLVLADGGGLVVEGGESRGALRLVSSTGWSLDLLLQLLGVPPIPAPDRPFRLEGLPAGTYTVSRDGASLTVSVRPGELAVARLP
jgi:hypothetical protein